MDQGEPLVCGPRYAVMMIYFTKPLKVFESLTLPEARNA